MTARTWYSRRIGRSGLRVIASRTGVRLAYRGRHGQVSSRSAYAKVGGFKLFATPHRRRSS